VRAKYKKRKTLKIMADWVSNLAPLGQNRVSRPPEQAWLCVNAGLFILFNWLFLVYQKERKYSKNNVTAWGRTWHLWLKTEQTNHQNKHAYSVKTAMELFSPFNIYSWITKKEKIAKTMSQLGIEPKTSG